MKQTYDVAYETYEEAKRRCEALRHLTPSDNCRKDVYRILFARNQEEKVSADDLFLVFKNHFPNELRRSLAKLRECGWQFTPPNQRAMTAYEIIGRQSNYMDVFCDFRCGGYRILGDILEDLNAQLRLLETKKNAGIQKGDSPLMKALLSGVFGPGDYHDILCRNCLNAVTPTRLRFTGENEAEKDEYRFPHEEIIQCAEALGKRDFILEVFPAAARLLAIDRTEKPKKKRWWHFAKRD